MFECRGGEKWLMVYSHDLAETAKRRSAHPLKGKAQRVGRPKLLTHLFLGGSDRVRHPRY